MFKRLPVRRSSMDLSVIRKHMGDPTGFRDEAVIESNALRDLEIGCHCYFPLDLETTSTRQRHDE